MNYPGLVLHVLGYDALQTLGIGGILGCPAMICTAGLETNLSGD